MAWKKTRSAPRRSRSYSKLARKRVTWVESLVIDPCVPLQVPWCVPTDGCCTTKWKIVLLDNTLLQDKFSDRASAVRLLGDLWINIDPALENAVDYFDTYDRLADSNTEMFVGLKRGETSSATDTLTSDIWDPAFQDLAESQFMKTWQHKWNPLDNFELTTSANVNPINFDMQFPVGTDDTHTHTAGVESCNEMATGSGFICIETDHSVDCETCPQTIPAGQVVLSQTVMKAARPWHIHFDIKKRIPMRENQELYLMFNARSFAPGVRTADFNYLMSGNMRTLVQMG